MSYFKGLNGKIFYRSWPHNNPKAVVVIAHGLGEHSGRYKALAEFLNLNDYSVYGLDHQGHGQSDGQRGHVMNFKDYAQDLNTFIELVKEQSKSNNIHLLGHSMGGLIVTSFVLRHSFSGSLMISAPAYQVRSFKNKCELFGARLLYKVAPKLSLSNGIKASLISRDEEVVACYLEDELVHDKVSLAFAAAFGKEQYFVKQSLSKIKLPTLMLLAGQDALTDPKASKHFFNQFSGRDKVLLNYPDAFHEVLNEMIEGPQAFAEIKLWLNKQLK